MNKLCILLAYFLALLIVFLFPVAMPVLPAFQTGETIEQYIEQMLGDMSLQEKVAQLIFMDIRKHKGRPVIYWNQDLKLFFKKYPVGGIILFGSNLRNAAQLQKLLTDIKNGFSQYPAKNVPFLAIDEEGGSISRLKKLPGLDYAGLPAALSLSQRSANTAEAIKQARKSGQKIGKILFQLGFQVNMAPVADLFPTPAKRKTKGRTTKKFDYGPIASRAFSAEPTEAAAMVKAFVEGMQEQKVAAVLKHFPGHGYTLGDPHSGFSIYYGDMASWKSQGHAKPFDYGLQAGANFVMLGHFQLPQITKDNIPASLNTVVIKNMLRKGLGFNGIVISDSFDMRAIKNRWDSAEAAIKFLQAGGDMILIPPKPVQAIEGVLAAVQQGEITKERIDHSLRRILQQKLQLGLFKF